MFAATLAARPRVALLQDPCRQTSVVEHLEEMEAIQMSPHVVQLTPTVLPSLATLRASARRRRKTTRATLQVMMTTTSLLDLDGGA